MAYAIATFGLCAVPLKALNSDRQLTQYGRDSWNYQNGLPGGAVYSVAQLKDGYLWLRQASGLLRFDGVRFVPVTPTVDGQPIREGLRATSQSADGSLLLRSASRTLRFRDNKFVDAVPPIHLADGMDRVVFEASDHTIWIGADSNLSRIRAGKLELISIGTGWITAITEDHDGAVWIGAASGLYRFKNERFSFYPTGFNSSVAEAYIPVDTVQSDVPFKNSVTALIEDRHRTLWVGTRGELYKVIDGKLIQDLDTQGLSGLSISALLTDHDGNLWAGTDGGGLFRHSAGGWSKITTADGLSDNTICSIAEDREGSIWIGTRSGLDRLRDTPLVTITAKEGLSHDNAAAVVEDKEGAIFVYTWGGGITRMKDGVTRAITTNDGLGSDYAGTLYAAPDGNLWVGTERGIFSFKNGEVRGYPDQGPLAHYYISAINEDDQGLVLATSQPALYRFKEGKFSPYALNVPPGVGPKNSRYVYQMNRDEKGTLWIAMSAGLYGIPKGVPPEKAVCSSYGQPVHVFGDDGTGFLWIAGPEKHGFTRMRKSDGQLLDYGAEAGISFGDIGHILFDREKNIWFGTRAGISRILRTELDDFAAGKIKTVHPFTYGIVDGMRTEEVSDQQPSGLRAHDGRLYFGTRKGLVFFDPENLPHNTRVPPVVTEEFIVDHEPQPPGRSIALGAGHESFEIHYTALSLVTPSRVRFKYRLQGYDTTWIDAGPRRTAYYTHLPPGSYTFRVIAANDDGVWNESGASFSFSLKPRFYQTTWFYLGCALLLAATGQSAYWIRTRQMRRRQAELEALIAERTRNLRDEVEEKTRTQQELQKYRAYLEQLVTERTCALQQSNEQLQREIAERRSGEAALRASEDRYRRFFQEDLAGAFIASPEGLLVTCNPSFLRAFGFPSSSDATGVPLTELFEKRTDAADLLMRVRRDGKVQDCELQMRSRDGRNIHVLANMIANFDSVGGLTEIKGYVLDMTDRKRLENQLRQSQKMEAVGQLAGGVAHDFNNLLTAIIGSSECILDLGSGDSDTIMLATEIRDAGKRAAALTRQLLAFSRKQVLQPKIVLLNDVVIEMERLLRRLIGEDIHLRETLAPNLRCIKADPNQLQQVLMNLTVNARDAMPQGGELRIETENATFNEPFVQGSLVIPAGSYVCLRVIDSGCGMSADVQAHIFEPFFTTKGVGKGTGLGLSTAYGIVQQSNGYISFISAPNSGTRFNIFFPVVEQPKAVERVLNPVSPIPSGKETILLVEDNELVLRVAQRTLQQVGFRVFEASNAFDALQRFRADPNAIDLLLTDLVMPDMNGRQLAEQVLSEHPSMKVLFMSGYTEDALVRVGGIENIAFLEKPFTADGLIRRVRQVLDMSTTAFKK